MFYSPSLRDILEPTVTPDESDDTPIFPPMPESQPEAKLDKQTGPSISLTNGTQSTSSQEGKLSLKIQCLIYGSQTSLSALLGAFKGLIVFTAKNFQVG